MKTNQKTELLTTENSNLEGTYVAMQNVEIFRDFKVLKGDKFEVKKEKNDIFQRFLIIKENETSHIEFIFLIQDIRLGYYKKYMPEIERPTDFPDDLH